MFIIFFVLAAILGAISRYFFIGLGCYLASTYIEISHASFISYVWILPLIIIGGITGWIVDGLIKNISANIFNKLTPSKVLIYECRSCVEEDCSCKR